MDVTLRLAWRNIWRNRRRSWLTILAIAFLTMLLVVMVPLQLGAYDVMIDASTRIFPGHAQIQAAGYNDDPVMHKTVPDAIRLAEHLRAQNRYAAVAARAQAFALVSSDKEGANRRSYGAQITGIEPKYEGGASIMPGRVSAGRYLKDLNAMEAVVGEKLARNLRIKVGDGLILLGQAKDGSSAAGIVKVVGIASSGMSELDRLTIHVPLGAFQSIFMMGSDAHHIAIIGHNIKQQAALMAGLEKAIAGHKGLVALGWTTLLPGLEEGIAADKYSGLVFMIILIAIVVFSIFNTFLMSVLERTREFGLMLALGARPRGIAGLAILESMLLTLIGLGIGMSIGGYFEYQMHTEGFTYWGKLEDISEQLNIPMSAIYPQTSAFTLLFGPVIIFLITNLTAMIPVLRVRKLEPVDAMRTI